MRAYKILQLVPRLDMGGAETIVLALNRGLVAHGMQSVVCSNGGILAEVVAADGGQHVPCDIAGKNILTAGRRLQLLRQLIKQVQPDLVHVHSRVPAWLLRFALDPGTPPVVSTVHGFHSNPWYSNILLAADRIICPCRALYNLMVAAKPDKKQFMRLVANGVDVQKFNPQAVTPQQCARLRAQLGIDAAAAVVTLPGRFSSSKGHSLLLQAFALLPNWSGVAPVLLFVGDGDSNQGLVARLHKEAASYGLAGRVLFASGLDMVEVLAISDVVVSASLRPEGFGLSIAEAQAMGKPVVAAAQGGALDLVEPGVNGELFTSGDYYSLASSLHQTMKKQWQGSVIRARICSNFTIAAMLNGTVQVYQELLS
ncbi:MAG: glycosyltransferase [Candidatus Porifericomitaceae bacterium WSBS_2022_MAG_OTU9]